MHIFSHKKSDVGPEDTYIACNRCPPANGVSIDYTSMSDTSSELGWAKRETSFSTNLTNGFLAITLLLAATIAFSIGTVLRATTLPFHPVFYPPPINEIYQATEQKGPPVLKRKATSSTTRILDQRADITSHTVHLDPGKVVAETPKEEDKEDVDGELYLPAGQHLLIDIQGVHSGFLDSENLLSQAMISLIDEIKLTLLSIHCHSLVPAGVSCVGVLLESHIALHTFPKKGVITVDLYTCGNKPLIPTLPIVEKRFAIPMEGSDDEEAPEPKVVWSHKLRGFRPPPYKAFENPLDMDLGADILRRHDLDSKIPLISDETDFQKVDIYETIDRRGAKDKILFLDGVHQSSLAGEAPYHEALVHPALVTHPNPKRVAIIGGGEGATLREVLKHKTVEEVVMIEIDEELVDICREYLPEWHNCSDIQGSDAESCFDDSRATMIFEDAFKWFMDRFDHSGNTADRSEDQDEEDLFDVIIMDALDPDKFVQIVGALYSNDHFDESLFKSLTEGGIFVVQTGETDDSSDPAIEVGPDKDTAHMMAALERVGFESMHTYDEAHSHFYAPWSYLISLKSYDSRNRWYRTEPHIELDLHQRINKFSSSGKPSLLYFDGATMLDYQLPSKAQEITYCRKDGVTCDDEFSPDSLGAKDLEESCKETVYKPSYERHSRHQSLIRDIHLQIPIRK